MASKKKNFMEEQAEMDSCAVFREDVVEQLKASVSLAKEAMLAVKLAAITEDLDVFAQSLRAAALACQRLEGDCQALASRAQIFQKSRQAAG